RTSAAVRFIEVFGTSSLAGYFLHEMLLYFHIFGFSFEVVWGNSCSWGKYLLVLSLLIAMTFALTWLVDRVYRKVDGALSAPPPPQARLSSTPARPPDIAPAREP